MKMKISAILLPAILIGACTVNKVQQPTQPTDSNPILIEGTTFSALYQQKAAEYKALCIQAYNIAQLRVDEYLAQPTEHLLPPAIVTDIDETFLNNAPAALQQSLAGKAYNQLDWEKWTAKAAADTLCGALDFFTYAASKGIEIFYVSNRVETERVGTLANLKKFQFPNADDKHLILRSTTSSKEVRRQQIAATHNIILLCGDNLSDFSALFDKKTVEERNRNVIDNRAFFGKKFIVLPNTTYGDWLSSLYQYNYKLSIPQIDSSLIEQAKNSLKDSK